MHTCTHAHTHTRTHARTHAHMHTRTHAHMHTCTHARKRPRTHARPRALALAGRARTSTRTLTRRLAFEPWPCFPAHSRAHAHAWPRAPRAPAAAGCAGNAPCGCCAHALTHARACTRAHAGEYARACACAHAAIRQHPPGRRPARAPRAPTAAAPPATPSRLRRWPWCARAPDFRLLSGGNSTHGAKAKHAD